MAVKSASDRKRAALDEVSRRIAHCRRCRQGGVGKPVPGDGNPDARIVFVGEAPGRTEAETGRPFVGRAGQWLRRTIRSIGLDEDAVYITSSLKYRPARGAPSPAAVAHGRGHLLEQLDIIQPEVVVLLGSTACQAVLNERVPVRDRHGATIERDGRTYLITCHPAAAARFPAIGRAVLEDFRTLEGLVERLRSRRV